MTYPTSKLNGLVGFAKAANVTGGWNGSVVEINTLAQLNQYVGDSTARAPVINSNITASSLTKVNLGSNKTIIGSFQNCTLNNINFRATTASQNIIFQNLIFQYLITINTG